MHMTARHTSAAAEEIIHRYWPVHDHGFVALVDYMGGDPSVERAARVSYGDGSQHVEQAEARSVSDSANLLGYLYRHAHTTPFEMAEVVLHCCMPIFVARQWIRHRTASVNEVSARYSVLPELFYTPERQHFAAQAKDNKQGRESRELEDGVYRVFAAGADALRDRTSAHYENMLRNGVARELARIDLPLSIYTQWYWKIDLKNLLHFLALRVDSHAQYEVRAYGEVIAGMVQRLAPITYAQWLDRDVGGVRLGHKERLILRRLVITSSEERSIAHTKGDGYVNRGHLKQAGFGERELMEFLDKFRTPGPLPDFALDLADSLSAGEMMARQQAAAGEAQK